MNQKILTLEVNEVPLRVFREYAKMRPESTIANILSQHNVVETWASDVTEDDLYPSQSWASMNTGSPYQEHKIRWYNDVKCFDDFFWHKLAKNGASTMLVGSLHTSPLQDFVEDGNYKLVVPDCFAPNGATLPKKFEPFQEFNLAVTGENGRKTSLGKTLVSAAGAFARSPLPGRWGLSPRSLGNLGKLTAGALVGNPERLRCAQFPMLAEIFLAGLKREKPDLAIAFTNHVAANMHRYWYALYPDDFAEKAYSSQWVERYRGEILGAMGLLDSWLTQFKRFAEQNDYLLLVVTSIGQKANQGLNPDYIADNTIDYRLDDPLLLLERLLDGHQGDVGVEQAMVPQYTFVYSSNADAQAAATELRQFGCRREQERHGYYLTDEARVTGPQALQGLVIGVEVVENKLTLTASISSDIKDKVMLGDRQFSPRELGFVEFEVDDHHSGCHSPAGTLLAVNDRCGLFSKYNGQQMDYLEYAPALLNFAA